MHAAYCSMATKWEVLFDPTVGNHLTAGLIALLLGYSTL